MIEKVLCPICGLELDYYPWENDIASFEICPCCGIQFGYDDMAGGDEQKRKEFYLQKRKTWIKNGKIWWSSSKPLVNWDPDKQLSRLEKP